MINPFKRSQKIHEIESDKNGKVINRREALTRASCMALSAATMMILLKSQPAKAASASEFVPEQKIA